MPRSRPAPPASAQRAARRPPAAPRPIARRPAVAPDPDRCEWVDGLRLVGAQEANRAMEAEMIRLSVRALGRRPPVARRDLPSELVYPFAADLAWVAACYHRTASRALWDLYRTRARRLEPLYADLRHLVGSDPRRLWPARATVAVRVRARGDFPAGDRQVVGTVKNAVIDGAAGRGARLALCADRPDVLLAARCAGEWTTVSIDLAGRGLHQRGWRVRPAAAPLRENLAAQMLVLARWDPRRETLCDPMCGGGTIAIEGALMARGAPLWHAGRRPACLALPPFSALRGRRPAPLFAGAAPLVVASDVDAGAVRATEDNLAAAGLRGAVRVRRGDFRALSPDDAGGEPGLIACNPPYGERLGAPEGVAALYRDLAAWLDRWRGWRAAFFVANPAFEEALGRRPRVRKPMSNADLRGWFLLYEL